MVTKKDCSIWLLSDLTSEKAEVALLPLIVLDIDRLENLVYDLLVLVSLPDV